MISLIVPVYNIKKYLDRCVSSILTQTYKEFELILVDDGSTDGSSDVCDFYVRQDSRVIVIHKQNGGLVSARKSGLKIAQGEYIGFVDGDDWIEPQMYEHLMSLVTEYQADMALGGSIEDVNGQTIYKTNYLKPGVYDKERLCRDVYPYMLCAGEFFCMGVQPYIWNKLIRRDLTNKHMWTIDDRIRIGEDVAAVVPMLLMADKVVISDACDYHYCIRETSMMRQKNENREWDEVCILHRFLESVFSIYLLKYADLERQLSHYTIGNMLTRAYEKLAGKDGANILWPFGYQIGANKCIVYSAGNFGQAVYGYLQRNHGEKCALWVDRQYQRYRSCGMSVCCVEDVLKEKQADILIAVLSLELAKVIREDLLRMGISTERIYCINVTDDDIKEILLSIC